jgi:hypothetical protein
VDDECAYHNPLIVNARMYAGIARITKRYAIMLESSDAATILERAANALDDYAIMLSLCSMPHQCPDESDYPSDYGVSDAIGTLLAAGMEILSISDVAKSCQIREDPDYNSLMSMIGEITEVSLECTSELEELGRCY